MTAMHEEALHMVSFLTPVFPIILQNIFILVNNSMSFGAVLLYLLLSEGKTDWMQSTDKK
jgi:hypothetical protein